MGGKKDAGDLLPFRRAIVWCCGDESTLDGDSQPRVELPQLGRFCWCFPEPWHFSVQPGETLLAENVAADGAGYPPAS